MRPLPGGVAAAAVAAAMGAALVVKAARISSQRQTLTATGQSALEVVSDLAQAQRGELVRLAGADERAYRAVLESRELAATHPARQQAWQVATEVPVRVAEACQALLARLPAWYGACQPVVRTDLDIGRSLLETGARAGLQAAESNLRAWGDVPEAQALRLRIDALQEGEN